MAYRFCGPSLAETLIESGSGSEAPSDPHLLLLLNEVMQEVDEAQRPHRFTIVIPETEQGMVEFSFVTEIPPDATASAHDPQPAPDRRAD